MIQRWARSIGDRRVLRAARLRPAGRHVAPLLLGVLLSFATGCAPRIQWRGFQFDPVFDEAQRADRLTFVFFKNWYSVESTRFWEDVLHDPAVVAATQNLYCVALDLDADYERGQAWGIERTPAYVIVDPQRRVLARRQGDITREDLLRDIERAREIFAGTR